MKELWEELNQKIDARVKELAAEYRPRFTMSILTMSGQECGCCEKTCSVTTSIEHESGDFKKDLSVCSDCYEKLEISWGHKPAQREEHLLF